MKSFKPVALAMACGMAGAFAPAAAFAQEAAPQQGGGVVLREVDIRAFIEDASQATGRTFIVDPRVSGRVTVLSQQTLSPREYFDMFMATLRVHGFIAVPTAQGAYRIVPDAVAAREPSARGSDPSENRYVTQVFSLRFADAEAVANTIRPMLTERGQATANRRGNSLVVVDYGSSIARLTDVIGRLDRDTSTYRTLRLRNTSAAEMARVAQSLVTAVGDNAGERTLMQAVPVRSSNSLVLRGDARMLDQIVPLLEELDVGADTQSGVQVIALRYAVAEDLVPILQQVSSALTDPSNPEGAQGANRRANIAAHKATNSLIISADPETQEQLANIVRALDVRREQILVEAIIVEVSDDAAKELGLQFMIAGDGTKAVPFLSTSYSNTAPNLLAITGALAVPESSSKDNSALDSLRQAAVSSLLSSSGIIAGAAGTDDDGSTILGLILNALAEDRDSNVLSTPSVMTLDNEKASILVGQQIPVTTGEALGTDFQNQFRTVRREDVGVQLEVTPQISEGGAIRLEIRQEVSSIFGQVISTSSDLITNRREIETVVQVDAGEVIVLGGLIQEDVQNSSSGVPYLRKIPLAGRLFSSEGRSRRRTNLMVFLRPTIVNTADQAADVTARQYRALRGVEGLEPGIAAQVESAIARQRASSPPPSSPQ